MSDLKQSLDNPVIDEATKLLRPYRYTKGSPLPTVAEYELAIEKLISEYEELHSKYESALIVISGITNDD